MNKICEFLVKQISYLSAIITILLTLIFEKVVEQKEWFKNLVIFITQFELPMEILRYILIGFCVFAVVKAIQYVINRLKLIQDQLLDISFRLVYLQGFIKNSDTFNNIEHKDIIADSLNNENVAYLFEMNKYQLEEQRKQEENNIELKNQGKEITNKQEIPKIRLRNLRKPLIMSVPDFEKIKQEFLDKYNVK